MLCEHVRGDASQLFRSGRCCGFCDVNRSRRLIAMQIGFSLSIPRLRRRGRRNNLSLVIIQYLQDGRRTNRRHRRSRCPGLSPADKTTMDHGTGRTLTIVHTRLCRVWRNYDVVTIPVSQFARAGGPAVAQPWCWKGKGGLDGSKAKRASIPSPYRQFHFEIRRQLVSRDSRVEGSDLGVETAHQISVKFGMDIVSELGSCFIIQSYSPDCANSTRTGKSHRGTRTHIPT